MHILGDIYHMETTYLYYVLAGCGAGKGCGFIPLGILMLVEEGDVFRYLDF